MITNHFFIGKNRFELFEVVLEFSYYLCLSSLLIFALYKRKYKHFNTLQDQFIKLLLLLFNICLPNFNDILLKIKL